MGVCSRKNVTSGEGEIKVVMVGCPARREKTKGLVASFMVG